MQRFSANLGFLWKDQSLLKAIACAARAGFRAVELHFPYDVPPAQVRDQCAEHGIKLLGINTNVDPGDRGHFGLGAIPGREDDFKTLAGQALDYARISGATAINVMAGKLPETEHEAGKQTFVSNLKWASARAQDVGVTLLLEPLNPKDAPGFFYSRVEQAAEIIDLTGVDNIRIMFDAYHVGVEQGDVIARLEALFGYVAHIQIAAVPTRREPDEGTFDYRTLFDALDQLGYDGWIGCEYAPRSSVEDGLVWTEKLGVSL